jgi:hypothetical protein
MGFDTKRVTVSSMFTLPPLFRLLQIAIDFCRQNFYDYQDLNLSTVPPTSLCNKRVDRSIGGLPRSYTRPREDDATQRTI